MLDGCSLIVHLMTMQYRLGQSEDFLLWYLTSFPTQIPIDKYHPHLAIQTRKPNTSR